jgi:hypothetical protein
MISIDNLDRNNARPSPKKEFDKGQVSAEI